MRKMYKFNFRRLKLWVAEQVLMKFKNWFYLVVLILKLLVKIFLVENIIFFYNPFFADYIRGNVFLYIMLKYILGTSYQLFVPLWVLIAR